MTPRDTPAPPPSELSRDLGLGGRLGQGATRLMNPDGSLNIVRGGLSRRSVIHPYYYLLTVSWPWFLTLVVIAYAAANFGFGWLYWLCGPAAIHGASGSFSDAFFFSVQTLATIGYGSMTPSTLIAHTLVSVEALTGLMGFALVTGLVFARFSRPSACVVFSRNAVIAPYGDGRALMFRLANARNVNLLEMRASVTLAWRRIGQTREFDTLTLERESVTFLALQWVVVHPIDESSPLFGMTEEEFYHAEPEVLVLISAIDEAFYQPASTRTSFRTEEIVWGAKFRDIHETLADGRTYLDARRLSEIDSAEMI
jgi:inward rectifier potassium channel